MNYVDTEEAIMILNKTLMEVIGAIENGNAIISKHAFKQVIEYMATEMIKASKPYPWGSNNLP